MIRSMAGEASSSTPAPPSAGTRLGRNPPAHATHVLTRPGPHVTFVLTRFGPYVTLMLTSPEPHAILAWQAAQAIRASQRAGPPAHPL